MRAALRIRLALVLVVAVAIPFAPGLSRGERIGLVALVLGYGAVSATFEALGATRPGFPGRAVAAASGVMAIFVATLILPELEPVALAFYLLAVTFSAGIGGMRIGFALAALALAGAIVAAAVGPTSDRPETAALVVFALAAPALVVLIEVLARGRRRTAERLERLHDALEAVTVTPDLQATLDSIVDSSVAATGASGAGILLREGDALVPAAPARPADWLTTAAENETSPFARARTRRETVVAPGDVSVVAIPMQVGGDVIGVLAAAFSGAPGLEREDLTLLETYAEQAALVVVQAQAYEREREATEQLAEADRRKGEFLGLVSHELRTPLTAVKGFVDTVLRHWDQLPEAKRRELLGRASGNADELNRMVGQLLDFARIEADRVQIEPRPVTVREAVDGALEELGAAMAKHQVTVKVPKTLAVTADPDALAHILVNLLGNAAKFSPAGGKVRVSARNADDEVVITVSDDGPGVAPDDRERVFERFYQSPEFVSSRKGTGIGLTITRTLVELHRGRIWVDRARGGGAAFSFTLPLASPEVVPEAAGAAAG